MQRLPAGPRPTGSPDTASACSRTALCHPVLAYFPAGIHQTKVRANDQLLIRRREPPRGEGSYQRAAVCCGSLVYPGPTLQRAGESLQHHVKGAGGNPASPRNPEHPKSPVPPHLFSPHQTPHSSIPISGTPGREEGGAARRPQSSFICWLCSPGHPGVLSRMQEGCARGWGWPFLTPSGQQPDEREHLLR